MGREVPDDLAWREIKQAKKHSSKRDFPQDGADTDKIR